MTDRDELTLGQTWWPHLCCAAGILLNIITYVLPSCVTLAATLAAYFGWAATSLRPQRACWIITSISLGQAIVCAVIACNLIEPTNNAGERFQAAGLPFILALVWTFVAITCWVPGLFRAWALEEDDTGPHTGESPSQSTGVIDEH